MFSKIRRFFKNIKAIASFIETEKCKFRFGNYTYTPEMDSEWHQYTVTFCAKSKPDGFDELRVWDRELTNKEIEKLFVIHPHP